MATDIIARGMAANAQKSSIITKAKIINALGYTPISELEKGMSGGVAELDENGKVLSSELPSYVDDVEEFESLTELQKHDGEASKIYVTLEDNKCYRWSGIQYVEISPSLALGETSNTAFRGDWGKEAYLNTHTHSNKDILDQITADDITAWIENGIYKVFKVADISTVTEDNPKLAVTLTANGYAPSDFLGVKCYLGMRRTLMNDGQFGVYPYVTKSTETTYTINDEVLPATTKISGDYYSSTKTYKDGVTPTEITTSAGTSVTLDFDFTYYFKNLDSGVITSLSEALFIIASFKNKKEGN